MSNPLHFSNRIVPQKRHSYEYWWDSPVESHDDDLWSLSDGEPITHGMYVKRFYYDLRDLLIYYGYSIENEKQFKSELATFIYHLSTEYHERRRFGQWLRQ